MKTESLGGFDRFRVPAALLVIAIHTGPLLSLNGEANYLLTDILARIAVPFFFSVSGWFLVPRLLREGRAALIPFVKKLLLLYGAAVLLYLPLNLYNHTLEESGFALLRDVLFNGTFYHLWYFPALVLGACLVYGLLRILGPRWAWLPALLLYAAGLLGDSYFGLPAAPPGRVRGPVPPLRLHTQRPVLPPCLSAAGGLAGPEACPPERGLVRGRTAPLPGAADGGGPAGAAPCPGPL